MSKRTGKAVYETCSAPLMVLNAQGQVVEYQVRDRFAPDCRYDVDAYLADMAKEDEKREFRDSLQRPPWALTTREPVKPKAKAVARVRCCATCSCSD